MRSTLELLDEFCVHPQAARYKADGERVKLLRDYLWCRALTPTLTFETYLAQLVPLADYDDTNLKHPEDAIAALLPRTAATAKKSNQPQVTAEQVVDLLALCVDTFDEARITGDNTQYLVKDFLNAVRDRYLANDPAVQPARPAPKRKKAAAVAPADPAAPPAPPATGVATLPDPPLVGTRVLWHSRTGGDQMARGVVQKVYNGDGALADRTYADVLLDDGSMHQGIAMQSLTRLEPEANPLPAAPTDINLQPIQSVLPIKHTLSDQEKAQSNTFLACTEPWSGLALGQTLFEPSLQLALPSDYVVGVCILNAAPRPCVVARLHRTDRIVHELPPRTVLVGNYRFVDREAGVSFDLTIE